MEKTTQVKATKTIAEQVLSGSQELASDLPLSSGSELNITENVNDILPDYSEQYSELDQFAATASKTGESSETGSEQNSESSQLMSDEDALFIASKGLGVLDGLASAYVGKEITVPDEQKEELATKGAIVIKKHFGQAEMPPWFKKWQEEISFGLALGTCLFSVYREKQRYDNEQAKLASEQGETTSEKGHDDVKVHFDNSYIT